MSGPLLLVLGPPLLFAACVVGSAPAPFAMEVIGPHVSLAILGFLPLVILSIYSVCAVVKLMWGIGVLFHRHVLQPCAKFAVMLLWPVEAATPQQFLGFVGLSVLVFGVAIQIFRRFLENG
jgi:hypothetical protein